MRITRFPRLDKAFGNDGKVVAESVVKQEMIPNVYAERGMHSSTAKIDEEEIVMWMASLHPIASLVRVAGENETPNVQLMERGGKLLCRTSTHSITPRQENVKGKGRADGKAVDYDSGDSDILLSDSLMELDFDSSPLAVIKAGEPLLRAAEVAPLVLDTDIESEEWELFLKEESNASSAAGTQAESSILFAGDTMLDADETEWGDDFAIDDEDFEAIMMKLKADGVEDEEFEDDDFMDIDGS
ncbi:uncharacterized protein BDZ99DRAFT_462858 [Mytilinidion resinicola]|uniref:Uncharacterized protein n=1 Tax=Mytilinidion resinicola TaxID=574789 RepID=A0A6A6YNA5_9PEZI|nr:uncharacterized protein BDZ99DRAFT_462858 [Mytilinidion resinicola]KAF2810270.1 hypothetical protein BDZ99DRAFT_462858 [Mytilinidion resinicola]